MKTETHPPAQWGAAVGARLARHLRDRDGLRLCLPTGDTPVPAYAAFVENGGRLDETEVFILDEFVLPARHPARCDEMLARALLDHVDVPPLALHKLDVAAVSLEDECQRYESLVADGGLDLTLLGLGGNGHLGLNEPGTAADSETRVVELHHDTIAHAAGYGDGAAPEHGVTLGLGTILASREIWLLVTGAHKAGILQRAVTGPIGSDVPASYLQTHPNVTVMADEAAASRLRSVE